MSSQNAELLRAGGRRVHRRGAAVGHPVPRPARLLDLVSGGDVVAQPRQPDDEPAAAGRVRRRADDHEPRRLSIGMVPVSLLAIAFFGFNLWALGFALAAFFANLILTSWAVGIFVAGLVAAQRPRRRELGLEHHVPVPAADLRLLPGRGAARLAAVRSPGAAADLRVRRHARAADRPRVPRRSDAQAFALNVVLFAAASFAFLRLLQSARVQGSLLQTGE